MEPNTILSILIGIGLAASVGFRVFVPLFALSMATHYGVIPLNESWEWVGSTTAMIALGIATLVEIGAYFIPFVDNLLDTIAIPLAAVAGTAVMVSTVADLSPAITWALAIIAGGGTATALANPIIATVETGTSIVMSVLSILFPIFAVIIVLLIFWILFKIFKRKSQNKEE